MEKLYMIEVLVSKIIFAELPVPLKRDIIISATTGNFASLEIRTDVMGVLENLEAKERSSKKKDVDIDCGRSVVFPINPAELKDSLAKNPLEVSVATKKDETPIGTVLIPWNMDFTEMVQSSEQSSGYVTPVYVEGSYAMTNGNNEFGGNIEMFVRLSFLGRYVFTNIQRMVSKDNAGTPGGEPTTYLFKSVDNATIFKCARHGAGSDSEIMPIGAIYSIANRTQGKMPAAMMSARTKSTETLLKMKDTRGSTASMCPSVFMAMGPQDQQAMYNSMAADDGMSLMSVGPLKGKKHFDLTELHMDVSTFSTIANALGMHMFSYSDKSNEGGEGGEDDDLPLYLNYKALTVSEIESRLCKHPDCPAAKLFKNYGIGPLAKNISGLGGMYKDVDAPCAYGLSHCNGTIKDYGPLGRFKRPKKAEEPFVPQSNCKCGKKSSSISTLSKESSTKKSSCYKHCPLNNKTSPPMRLRGGSPVIPECNPLPNPLTLCQDLMDDFNKVLREYKDALGPCGQATCPFALNVIGEACQEICNTRDPERARNICDLLNPEAVMTEKDDFTGCGVPNCPYKRAAISPAEKDFSKYQGMPGCGYTNCPFVRAKLGMEADEDTHLPPFKDYEKQETYKYTEKLPPIHWDCPDPLPQGDCKNPDCPYVKRDALIKKYFPEPCCPCGSPACPYVCAPCSFPGCPFSVAEPCPPVCPYTEPPPKELKCTPSVCPFARMSEVKCESPECPYRQYEERLEECAKAKMEEERLKAEQDEEEEDDKCKACGRAKRSRSGNFSKSSRNQSTSKISFTNRSVTNTSNTNPENTSEPCILSATAYKKGDERYCTAKTCGTSALNINGEKHKKSKRTSSNVSFNPTSSSTNPYEKEIKKSIETGNINSNMIIKKSSFKEEKINFAGGSTEPKKEVAMLPLKAPKPEIKKPSKLCRKSPFTFDRKSYKPCNKIGHRECVLPKFLVPKDMGWLWNVHTDICGLRPRRGWKPGAVSKMIALRIDYFNAQREKRPWKSKSKSKNDLLSVKPSKPTVSINKKAGVVNVTMLPIKDPAEAKKRGDGNQYMDCTPIKFKITKNDPEKEKRYCYCGGEVSDTSSSELDIEFTPPAGMKNPRLFTRNQLLEQEVQYNINDVPLPPPPPPPQKKKGTSRFWHFWRRIVYWEITQDQYYFKFLNFHLKITFEEANCTFSEPLRLRGGGPVKVDRKKIPNASSLCKDLMDDYDKLMCDYKKALGPCGTAICPMNFNVLEDSCRKICRSKNTTCDELYCPPPLGPCGKHVCPHLTNYSLPEDDNYEDEQDWSKLKACWESCGVVQPDGQDPVPCGRTKCPFGKPGPPCPDPKCKTLEPCIYDLCEPTKESRTIKDPTKTAIRCNKHICPFKRDELTVDDVNPANRKIKSRKGCGSPFCPHAAPKIENEITMPKFPCKKPCPSIEELPPIHWDCPDPLPMGECTNPNCPLRERLPCGHCQISQKHCGYPGCPFAGDDVCPPTCPYTQRKPPKFIECTPSVCPFVRPCGYRSLPSIARKAKPCNDRCPYNKKNIYKKSCGSPQCPFRTCADENSRSVDECSNPECPYKRAAKKLAEKVKSIKEPTSSYVQSTTEHATNYSKSNRSTNEIQFPTFSESNSHKEEVVFQETASLSTKPGRVSSIKKGILKMMQTSMSQFKRDALLEEADQEPNVCRESSCASFSGQRMCKRCRQRNVDNISGTEKEKSRRAKKNQKRKKKKHWGYVYDKGTYYPGIKFGHKECNIHAQRVPWDMGWKWNVQQPYFNLKPRKGWRPGAIGKTILKSINEQRKKLGLPPRPMIRHPFPASKHVNISDISGTDLFRRFRSRTKMSQENLAVPKPTLSIKKKDGIVYVKMNPLKDPSTMDQHEYPYIDCSPLEFKIIKKKTEEEKIKCMCGGEEEYISSEESSELDIEFTPPAGIVRQEVMQKNKHICHTESQYNKADIPKTEEELEAERAAKNKKKKGKNKGKKDKKGKKGKKK